MKAFFNYAVVSALIIGFLSFYIPIRYDTPYPRSIGPQFDWYIRDTYINFLNEEQPYVYLLGDSMPGADIDETYVSKALGEKVELNSLPGTASTIWYLMIKNNFVLAEHKPKYLVIFFRDSMMTVPSYRVTGRYFELIDEYASPADTLLIQRAYINQMGSMKKIMERYIPLYGSRQTIRQTIDYYIRYPFGHLLLKCDLDCINSSMDNVFDQNNIDPIFFGEALDTADSYLYTREALNFNKQVDESFLPEIIRLCRENDIELIMVRMPIMRFYRPGTKPPGLDRYVREMSVYLKANHVPFLDFDQKELPAEYFKDMLHLNEKGKAIFTQKLSNALKEIVK